MAKIFWECFVRSKQCFKLPNKTAITKPLALLCLVGFVQGCASTGENYSSNAKPPSRQSVAVQLEYPNKTPKLAKKIVQGRSLDEYMGSAIKRDDSDFLSIVLSEKPHLVNQQQGEGGSLLHLAAAHKSYSCVALLLRKGADIYLKDSFGESVNQMAQFNSTLRRLIQKYARGNHE